MKILQVLAGGIIGTTFMTAFSYAVSEARNKQFKEPELLNSLSKDLEHRAGIKKHSDVEGWLMHYGVGLLFSAAYDQLWKRTKIKPSPFQSMILGGITGIFGVGIWRGTFKLHPAPPTVHFKEYYVQLLAAHIIFGVFAAIGYKIPDRDVSKINLPLQK